jgi:hypothetical protein
MDSKVTAKDAGAIALFLTVAAVFHAWYSWYHHDWLLTTAWLTLMYGGFSFACHKMNEDFYKEAFLSDIKEMAPAPIGSGPVPVLKAAGITGAGAGLGLGVGLVLYCLFLSFGPSEVYFQTPYFGTSKDWMYWGFFGLLFVIFYPIAESVFLYGFARTAFPGGKAIVVALLYTLVQASWVYWTIRQHWACWLWLGLSFGLCFALQGYAKEKGVVNALGLRVGINLGLFIVLVLILTKTVKHQPLKSPLHAYIFDIRNFWLNRK